MGKHKEQATLKSNAIAAWFESYHCDLYLLRAEIHPNYVRARRSACMRLDAAHTRVRTQTNNESLVECVHFITTILPEVGRTSAAETA